MLYRWIRGILLPALLLAPAGAGPVRAAVEYIIGAEDVLALTVWEHPELSRTVVVRMDGTITLPPLGDITAVGKATAELARDVEARIYSTLRVTTQATVTVVAFNSRKVYLAGQVTAPGRYSFEEMPGLLDLLGAAGGLGATADLAAVRILRRKEGGNPETITVDLATAVQTGDVSTVPKLQPGDVVFVPGVAAGGLAGTAGSGVYVLGEVLRPGAYAALPGANLLQILALAGGLSSRADLSQVLVLGTDPEGGVFRVKVDVRREMETGGRGPEVRPGDTVVVPAFQAGTATQAWAVLRESLGISRDVLNLFLIKDVLNSRTTH